MAAMRDVIDPAGFEEKFRENIDPWDYDRSPFEAFKRATLLRACGTRPFGRGLELACAIGATTQALAPRCLRLTAVDASPTALAEAARRLAHLPRVTLRRGILPGDLPQGPFDLIVASEILYYLPAADLRRLVSRMAARLAPGGRIVLVHHLTDFADAAVKPRAAQALAVAAFGRSMRLAYLRNAGRFQAAAFVKGAGPRRG